MAVMKSKKALVIDSNDYVSRFFEIVLGETHSVCRADNGIDGLKQIRENSFDLIVSEYEMPFMNGMEMFSLAEKIDPALKDRILFISSTDDDKFLTFVKERDIAYIQKPASVTVIKDMVKKVINA